MEKRQSREILWESWQVVWRELTEQQDPPAKPKEEKKSLMGKLKRSKQPSWQKAPMTLDQWKAEVKRVKQANEDAAELWAAIAAESDAYQAPTEADGKLLMNLFARSPGAMTKQVNAVRQIAEQGGNSGRVFADYQQGKDIDLPLLAAVCQRPDLFLEDCLLKDFMMGFPDGLKNQQFGRCLRFFPDHV